MDQKVPMITILVLFLVSHHTLTCHLSTITGVCPLAVAHALYLGASLPPALNRSSLSPGPLLGHHRREQIQD